MSAAAIAFDDLDAEFLQLFIEEAMRCRSPPSRRPKVMTGGCSTNKMRDGPPASTSACAPFLFGPSGAIIKMAKVLDVHAPGARLQASAARKQFSRGHHFNES